MECTFCGIYNLVGLLCGKKHGMLFDQPEFLNKNVQIEKNWNLKKIFVLLYF